jgi:hypothetical protein
VKVREGIVIDADIPPPDADGRKEAVERSKDCPYCGSEGMVIVDNRRGDVRVKSCAATCVCVHGRWIRTWHATKGHHHTTDRLPDLRTVLKGQDPRWRYIDHGPENQADDPPPAFARSDINKLFRRPA